MGATHIGTSLGAWCSLLTINSRQPLWVDGYDSVGLHHANYEQGSARIFTALGRCARSGFFSSSEVSCSSLHFSDN
jgi:hypothetical protein